MNQIAQVTAEAFAPLMPHVAWHVCTFDDSPRVVASHRDGDVLNIGSCFKAVVLATCCQMIEDGTVTLDEPLTLSADVRAPSSDETEPLPDRATISLRTALEAMIRSSDNTATDLILARIGHERIQALLQTLDLSSIRIPTSVRAYYAQSEDAAGKPTAIGLTGTAGEAPISTMADLANFHLSAFNGDPFRQPATQTLYRDILHTEDLKQGTRWPAEIVCFRKGGYVELHPFYAAALGGVMEGPTGEAGFAFALNLRLDEPNDEPFDTFSRAIGTTLRALAGSLTDQR